MGELIRRRGMVSTDSGGDPYDGYYGTGLVIRLDGIKNTRQGHQSTIANWENLISSSYDFALESPTINADSVYFADGCGAICEDPLTMPTNYTVEIYLSYGNAFGSFTNDSSLVEMMKSNQYGIMLGYKWNNYYFYPNNGRSISVQNPTQNQKLGMTLVKSGTTAQVYIDGVLSTQITNAANTSQSIVKTRFNGKLNTNTYLNLRPTIYSFRVYTDAISSDKVLANHNNDVTRFS